MQNPLGIHSLAHLKRLVVTGFSDESEALENIQTSSSILLERGAPFLLRTHSLLQRLKSRKNTSGKKGDIPYICLVLLFLFTDLKISIIYKERISDRHVPILVSSHKSE